MSTVRHERVCWLEGNLRRFEPLWWWLEYWGDWAATGGYKRTRNPLAVMMDMAEDGFMPRSTADDGLPDDIAVIERCLARVKANNGRHFGILSQIHIGKMTRRELAGAMDKRTRGIDRELWHVYSAADAAFMLIDPYLRAQQAPVFCRT
jgi:hypothetical protein